jgi:Fe-S-cluster containining protein
MSIKSERKVAVLREYQDQTRHLPVIREIRGIPANIKFTNHTDFPPRVTDFINKVARDTFQLCSKKFKEFPKDWSREKKLTMLVREILLVCDELIRTHIESLVDTQSKPPDCKQGCAWCCTVQVSVTSSELRSIFYYVKERFSEQAYQDLRSRVMETSRKSDEIFGTQNQSGYIARYRVAHERTLDMDAPRKRATAQLPCPFLVSNKCSIYPVRPLLCRGYTSQNVESCKDIETNLVPHNVFILAVSKGLWSGLGAFEISISEPTSFELTEGMRAVFEGTEG